MALSFFQRKEAKKDVKDVKDYRNDTTEQQQPITTALEEEEMDENFFYKHISTHFHSLFRQSTIVCVPHSSSIEGLVLTKDIIEAHCFKPSPFFCGQYMTIKQKQKFIALDDPIITTTLGFKEERTVNILAEETVYLKDKKIKVLLIDRLLEGEPPKFNHHQNKHVITIPPVRNSRTDLEFLKLFPQNSEAIHDLEEKVNEFIGSFVYIKGFNKATVERIERIYENTYKTILQRNEFLQESCRTPSEHDLLLELVENVVMAFLHRKIYVQSLRSLLSSQDNYLDSICRSYVDVTLSQYSLRHPISEMHSSCFHEAIQHFRLLDSDQHAEPSRLTSSQQQAFTPLEKLAVLKSTLDLISTAVYNYVQDFGNGNCDASVTSDEMIPLLAFVIVQSNVRVISSLIYYMQHYRLARMVEGSVYSFVITTMKTACEFLKDDPLSLYVTGFNSSRTSPALSNHSSTITSPQNLRSRSTSFSSLLTTDSLYPKISKPNSAPSFPQLQQQHHHRKTQSADLHNLIDLDHLPNSPNSFIDDDTSSGSSSPGHYRRNSNIIRPHVVLPHPAVALRHSKNNDLSENRKSLDIPNDWLLPNQHNNNSRHHNNTPHLNKMIPSSNLALSRPMFSTTFPSISNSTPLPLDESSTTATVITDADALPTLPVIKGLKDEATNNKNDMPKLNRSLSTSTAAKKHIFVSKPPAVINIRDRIEFDGIRRPASICVDTRSLHSIEDGGEPTEEMMGDFLTELRGRKEDIVGARSGSFRTFRRQ